MPTLSFFGVVRLCLLELLFGGPGTPLGTAFYNTRPLQSDLWE